MLTYADLAKIIQSLFIVIGAIVFWVGRAQGSEDVWGTDPLL